MSCSSSTSIFILFNSSALEHFNPTKGIYQGDPLSLYLFILCMEYSGSLIERECMEGNWTPVKASGGNIGISHPFFADDLMLFAKASEDNCETINEVLECFCAELSQTVSVDKSRIYFFQNVSSDLKEIICENIGVHATNNLGKYLGFPLRHKGVARNQYNFIAERVINKLFVGNQNSYPLQAEQSW